MLVVNIGSGSVAGGSGGQYFIGQFDGTRFVADEDSALKPALWFDYAPDYYAAVSWSDVPESDGRRLWLGWMSNWQYGQDVPTSPWRSAMSIPREVGLSRTPEGIRLVQKPVRELRSLRSRQFRFKGGGLAAANEWLVRNHIRGDQLEVVLEFAPGNAGVEGLKLLKGNSEETVIGVNRDQGTVYIDRTHSGNVGFNPKFPGSYAAPLGSRDGTIRLHVFVDACSVEAFVNDGERVLTSLVFPSSDSRGLEFFGTDADAKVRWMDVWTLKSIWK